MIVHQILYLPRTVPFRSNFASAVLIAQWFDQHGMVEGKQLLISISSKREELAKSSWDRKGFCYTLEKDPCRQFLKNYTYIYRDAVNGQFHLLR